MSPCEILFCAAAATATAEDFSLRKNKKPQQQQLLMHPNQSSCTDDRAMGKFGFEQEFLVLVCSCHAPSSSSTTFFHTYTHTHSHTYSPFIIAVAFHPQQLIQARTSGGPLMNRNFHLNRAVCVMFSTGKAASLTVRSDTATSSTTAGVR